MSFANNILSFIGTLDYRLQITDYILQTTDYILQTTGFRLHTTGFRLQTLDYRLRTTDYILRTTDYRPECIQKCWDYRAGWPGSAGPWPARSQPGRSLTPRTHWSGNPQSCNIQKWGNPQSRNSQLLKVGKWGSGLFPVHNGFKVFSYYGHCNL